MKYPRIDRSLSLEDRINDWQLMINDIINGKYEYDLINIGGIVELINRKLSSYDDDSREIVALNSAINNCIQTWNPIITGGYEEFSLFLDLISEYKPSLGYSKIFNFFKLWGLPPFLNSLRYRNKPLKEIFIKAYIVINRFYLTPPIGSENYSSYKSFVILLWEMLEVTFLKSLSLERLFDLNEFIGTDNKASKYILKDKSLLKLSAQYLTNHLSDKNNNIISFLYITSIGIGTNYEKVLFEELKRLAFEISIKDNNISIKRGDYSFQFELPDAIFINRTFKNWNNSNSSSSRKSIARLVLSEC